MRILHLCGWYLPMSVGGTELYVAALVRRQRGAGHEVRVAAPDAGAIARRIYEHEGVQVLRYPIAGSPTRAEARHVVPVRGAEVLHAWIRDWKPDVVHVHTFVTGVGPWEIRASAAAGARVVCTTHSGALGFLCARGTMLQWGTSLCDGVATPRKCGACMLAMRGVPRPLAECLAWVPLPLSSWLGRLPGPIGTGLGMPAFIRDNLRLQHQVLSELDAFVVLTEAGQQRVVRQAQPGAPIRLNRLGVNERPRPFTARRRAAGRALTVAYVGRLDPIKGVFDLARAIRALGPRSPLRFEFRAPVNSSQQMRMADRLKKLVGPDAHVRFGSPLSPSAVPEFLASVDLLCCPSITFEGGPTVALEALAAGTPVLGTRIGGLSEIIEDDVNGRLVEPGDWRALAAVLRAVGSDLALVERWRAGIGPVRTMDDVAADYAALYENVAGQPG